MKPIRYLCLLILTILLPSCSDQPSSEPIVTRAIKLSETFTDTLLQQLGYQAIIPPPTPAGGLPLSDIPPEVLQKQEQLKVEAFKRLFAQSGINFTRKHDLKYSSRPSLLLVTHTAATIKKIEKLLSRGITGTQNVKLDLQVVQLPKSKADEISKNLASRATQELDEQCLKLISEEVSRKRGFYLIKASGTGTNGEEIKILQEQVIDSSETMVVDLNCKPYLGQNDDYANLTFTFACYLKANAKTPKEKVILECTTCLLSHQDKYICFAASKFFSINKEENTTVLALLKTELEQSTPLK
jgi:hypothetical protein